MRNINLIVCTHLESHKNIYSRSRWFVKFSFSVTFTANQIEIFFDGISISKIKIRQLNAKVHASQNYLGCFLQFRLLVSHWLIEISRFSGTRSFCLTENEKLDIFHFRGIFHVIKYQILMFTETLFGVNFSELLNVWILTHVFVKFLLRFIFEFMGSFERRWRKPNENQHVNKVGAN